MKTVPLFLSAILSLCIAAACPAEEANRPFPTKDGFTLHLPIDWKPIPGDVLNAYTREIARLAPQAEKQIYDYGFQRADTHKWFAYPYILVQVKRSGRIPEDQLRSLTKIGEAMDSSFAKAGESISSFATNGKIGETVLDPATHTLWTRIAIDVKGVGTINGLIGTVLTEAGFIQISCYAKEKEFPGYLPVFEAIVRGTVLSDEMKYRSVTGDSEPASAGIGKGVIAGIAVACVVAVGVLSFLIRKRRKNREC
jgi:hypothetical protein